MKKEVVLICLLFVFIINLSSVMAIRINEVELNPAGDDSGNEWIEIYSEDEVDLQGWKLINGDDGIFSLDGRFKGFYVVEFPSQWLDNKDEKVILKDSENKTIDKTDFFADSSNNDKTWQFCETWIFEISTKDDENSCPEEQEEKNEETEEEQDEENNTMIEDEEDEEETEVTKKQAKTTEKTKKVEITQTSETEQTGSVIRLGDRKSIEEINANEETLYESSTALIKKYGIYAFSLLLIAIIIIMFFKIRKLKKQNV